MKLFGKFVTIEQLWINRIHRFLLCSCRSEKKLTSRRPQFGSRTKGDVLQRLFLLFIVSQHVQIPFTFSSFFMLRLWTHDSDTLKQTNCTVLFQPYYFFGNNLQSVYSTTIPFPVHCSLTLSSFYFTFLVNFQMTQNGLISQNQFRSFSLHVRLNRFIIFFPFVILIYSNHSPFVGIQFYFYNNLHHHHPSTNRLGCFLFTRKQ